jgi:hypothetical protein
VFVSPPGADEVLGILHNAAYASRFVSSVYPDLAGVFVTDGPVRNVQ